MKLFLASLASATLDLARPLLPKDPHDLKVAFIPTAADPYNEGSMPWMDSDRNKLIEMGFAVTDYDLKGKNKEILRKDLQEFDVIFVAGGNTFYLLNEVRKSDFDIVIKELLEKGVVYIGSSAGSCLMCSTIEHVELFDHKDEAQGLIDFTGLGYFDQLILPHFGKSKYADRQTEVLANQKFGKRILPLRDNEAVMINGSVVKVVTVKK